MTDTTAEAHAAVNAETPDTPVGGNGITENSSEPAQQNAAEKSTPAQAAEATDEKEQSAQEKETAEKSVEAEKVEEDTTGDLTDDELDHLDAKVKAKLSKTNREAVNLRSRLKSETARADRAEVAMAAGLPFEAVKFLTGNSREEMEANAEELLVMLGTTGRVTPPGLPVETGQAQPAHSAPDTDLDGIGARMYSR